MNRIYPNRLALAGFVLGGFMLSACAVQQPMASAAYAPVQKQRPNSQNSSSVFAAKRVSARVATAPQPLVAAEPAPELQAAAEFASAVPPQAEPAPEPQPQAAAEPAPKPRGPLTQAEENEIDTQVMP